MSGIDNKILVAIAAILCVTMIEVAAMFNGLNGTYLSLAVGAITTIVGYVYGLSKAQETT